MTYECTFCGHEGHSEAFCPTAIAIRQAEALERIAEALEKLIHIQTGGAELIWNGMEKTQGLFRRSALGGG